MLAKLKMQTRKIQLENLSWYSVRDIFDNKDKEELIVLIYDGAVFCQCNSWRFSEYLQ